MNDTNQNKSECGSFAPIIGFALGALLGGALGVLLAPASGERTRRRIGNVARRMTNDARHTLEDARDSVTDAASGLGADMKSALDAGRKAFQHDGDGLDSRPALRKAPELVPPNSRS
jgi:gas vesicle protein